MDCSSKHDEKVNPLLFELLNWAFSQTVDALTKSLRAYWDGKLKSTGYVVPKKGKP